MAEVIQHDDDELWRGAGKVLALNMLVDNMLREMKLAQVQYADAFGVDPEDQASQEGKKNYEPCEEGGLAFCINLMALIGIDADAVRAASAILSNSNEAATDAAGTGGGGKH